VVSHDIDLGLASLRLDVWRLIASFLLPALARAASGWDAPATFSGCRRGWRRGGL